jgi:sugar phosphate isomerase/epimerase
MNPALYVHVPAQLLPARLGLLLQRRLQPEIACQDINLQQLDFQKLGDCATTLAAAQLSTTLHAPFNSFNPGSSRRGIRQTSHEMARQTLLLAEAIQAKRIIFHPGLPYRCTDRQQELWLRQNLAFWPEFIAMGAAFDCVICLENIYEAEPDLLLQLCRDLASPWFGHCFDIGHWHIFGTVKLETWLDQAAPHLKHLHLHDNLGDRDAHLPLGQGSIDFFALFNWLGNAKDAPTLALEAHNLSDLDISLAALEPYLPG